MCRPAPRDGGDRRERGPLVEVEMIDERVEMIDERVADVLPSKQLLEEIAALFRPAFGCRGLLDGGVLEALHRKQLIEDAVSGCRRTGRGPDDHEARGYAVGNALAGGLGGFKATGLPVRAATRIVGFWLFLRSRHAL